MNRADEGLGIILRYWASSAVLWLGLGGLVMAATALLSPSSPYRGDPAAFLYAILTWVEWVVFAVPIYAVSSVAVVTQRSWRRTIPVHVVAAVFFSLLHLSVYVAVRWQAGDIATDLGVIDYVWYRLPRHLLFGGIIYTTIAIGAHAVQFAARAEKRALQQTLQEEELARVRLQTMRSSMQPRRMLAAMDAIAALLATDSARAERAILELSEELRTLLKAAREEERA